MPISRGAGQRGLCTLSQLWSFSHVTSWSQGDLLKKRKFNAIKCGQDIINLVIQKKEVGLRAVQETQKHEYKLHLCISYFLNFFLSLFFGGRRSTPGSMFLKTLFRNSDLT